MKIATIVVSHEGWVEYQAEVPDEMTEDEARDLYFESMGRNDNPFQENDAENHTFSVDVVQFSEIPPEGQTTAWEALNV